MIPKIFEQLKTVLPVLNKVEREYLKTSLLNEGQQQPIITCQIDGTDGVFILDGHNRYELLTELNIEPKFSSDPRTFKCKEDAMVWIIDNQITRRNVPQYVRAALVLKKKDFLKKVGKGIQAQSGLDSTKKRQDPEWLRRPLVANNKPVTVLANLPNPEPHNTRAVLAKEAGVSERNFDKIAKIEKEGSEDLKKRAMTGEISVDAAYKELRGLNSDEPPISNLDKMIEKIDVLANDIFDHNKELNDDQRENIFDITEVLDKCVHVPEEYNPNLPSFGDYET